MKRGLVLAWVLTAVVVCASWAVSAQPEPLPEIYPGQLFAWDPAGATSQKRTAWYEYRYHHDLGWRKVGLTRQWPMPTTLPPGEYQLEVRACNALGVCSHPPATLRVRLLPADAPPRSPINVFPVCRAQP